VILRLTQAIHPTIGVCQSNPKSQIQNLDMNPNSGGSTAIIFVTLLIKLGVVALLAGFIARLRGIWSTARRQLPALREQQMARSGRKTIARLRCASPYRRSWRK